MVGKVTQSKSEKRGELTYGWWGMQKRSHEGDRGRAASRIGGEPGDGLWSSYEEFSEGGSGPRCQVSCKLKSALWI